MSLTEGQVFAGYAVVRPLGTGGMGEVYLVRHPRLPRLDALKVLPESVSADEEFRARFNREADLAATLWHPHIVGVHDRGEFEDRLWISMDFVEGNDAARLSREKYPGGMPANDVVEIVSALAEALDYAHQQGLLHRDVKPANILLTAGSGISRRILLADFGIARHADDDGAVTRTNMTVGSVSHTAPEQLMGDAIDGRADQYSLAATAFHLLTGAPPFVHSNPAVVISRHLGTAPPTPSAKRAELRAYDAVITRALAKDPAGRFGSCREFAQALAGAATGIAAGPVARADPAPVVDSAPAPAPSPQPTTSLSTPPMITGAADPGEELGPVPSAEPANQHSAAPVIVSTWGQEHPTDDDDPAPPPIPTPSPEPLSAAPRQRIPRGLVVTAAIAAVGLIAAGTFAIMDSSQPTQRTPTAAPTTTGSLSGLFPTTTELSAATQTTGAVPPATRTMTKTVTQTSIATPYVPPAPPSPYEGPTSPRLYDPAGAFSYVLPSAWRVADTSQLSYGSVLLNTASGDNDTSILMGRLDLKLFAGAETNNMKAAQRLCSDMGEFFMPFPGTRVDQETTPVNAASDSGVAAYFRVIFRDRTKSDGQIWCAAIGSGYSRRFVLWLGTSDHPVNKLAALALAESTRP